MIKRSTAADARIRVSQPGFTYDQIIIYVVSVPDETIELDPTFMRVYKRVI